jgi:hypothetical protein
VNGGALKFTQGVGSTICVVTPVSAGVFEQGAPIAFACAACKILIYSPFVPLPVATTLKELVPDPQPERPATVCGAYVEDAFDWVISVCKEESTHLLRLTYLLAASCKRRMRSDCVMAVCILNRRRKKKSGPRGGKIDSPRRPGIEHKRARCPLLSCPPLSALTT